MWSGCQHRMLRHLCILFVLMIPWSAIDYTDFFICPAYGRCLLLATSDVSNPAQISEAISDDEALPRQCHGTSSSLFMWPMPQ